MNWRALAAKYDIPYRGLPEIASGRQYELAEIPILIEHLRSAYYLDREVAAQHIGSIATRCQQRERVDTETAKRVLKPAVGELKPLLEDDSKRVQRAATNALTELKPYFPEEISESALTGPP